MNPQIRSHLEKMRGKYSSRRYDEIIHMDWITEDPIKINGKKLYPSVWGQEFHAQALLVVQLTRWYIFNWFGATD